MPSLKIPQPKPTPSKVTQYAFVHKVTDSEVSRDIRKLHGKYKALVSELLAEDGTVEGTILYVPGIPYRLLKK